MLILAEITSRVLWPKTMGTPGFAVPDPQRFYVLNKNYKGWFQGHPTEINNFGMRHKINYKVGKDENTFRILILGDSVTFGDGNRLETTYPYQLEGMLKSWEPKVDWQVWNGGVPGYDAVTELRTLEEIGPIYNPDLVIVGTYQNDLYSRDFDYRKNSEASWLFKFRSLLIEHTYIYHQIKRMINVDMSSSIKNKFIFTAFGGREREKALFTKSLSTPDDVSKFKLKHQTINRKLAAIPEYSWHPMENGGASEIQYQSFEKANLELQNLHNSGKWDILFFLNIAPDISEDGTSFINGEQNSINQYMLDILSKGGVPVISSYEAFWSYSPYEVPEAGAHALGAANKVKASILLDHLKYKFNKSGDCLIGKITCSN